MASKTKITVWTLIVLFIAWIAASIVKANIEDSDN